MQFGYDALGRRTHKHFRGKLTRWVWDGDVPLHKWAEYTVGTEAGSAEELITWLFEADSFAPLARLTPQSRLAVVADHLGTPLELVDEEGSVVWGAQLDSYGRVRQGTGKASLCPFRYQGQYEDAETGLYYNRFRYYAPQEGIYLSQDPIGLDGGFELYGYVLNTNGWVDPSGLSKTPTHKLQSRWKRYVGKRHTNPDIHHGFPEEYADDFKRLADIDVNNPKYYYNLPKSKHTKKPGIHTNSSRTGQNWNKTWGGLIKQVENMNLSKDASREMFEKLLRGLARKERISKYNSNSIKNMSCP